MGCGSSSFAVIINLDRPDPFYFAGEVISGVLQFNVNDETVEVDELVLKFVGESGYTTRYRSSRTTRTQHHAVAIINTNHVLAHPPAGQKELRYGRGQYTFPFQFQLPNNLPPSLNPHVRYYVQMYVDKAWHKANTQENKYITIYPHVNIKKTPIFLQPTMFGDQNRKDIVVQGTLQITVSMFKNYRIANSTHEEVVTSSTIPELMNRKQPKLNGTFSVVVPTTENASYSQKLHIPALPSELK
ncbi:unnamed protein product [Adineta steineri]|uniref:Arrestin-like N-terminal domain-containing protein n=1 Tax=Adineta steineri TaxID=433720 RepID=A0A815Q2U8_9BILA|nr:unnamed protein product [Adineta steineri]CAF3742729.1 unnamed protein product [Adineta steineri]